MQLRAFTKAIQAVIRQIVRRFGKRRLMHAQVIGEQVVERFLSRKIRRILEKLVAQLLLEPDNLKKVAVAIARQRGNAHARQHLAQPGMDRRTHRFRRFRIGGQHFRRAGELHRQARHHRAGPTGHQQRHVMRIENLRRLDNQRHIPPATPHHVFPHRGCRQQRRHWRTLRAHRAIGKEEEPRTRTATQRGS